MSRRFGPIRVAKWGEKIPWHWRGWAVSWETRKRIINLQLDYEKRSS